MGVGIAERFVDRPPAESTGSIRVEPGAHRDSGETPAADSVQLVYAVGMRFVPLAIQTGDDLGVGLLPRFRLAPLGLGVALAPSLDRSPALLRVGLLI
jgi:hypothetical protein